MLILRFTIWVVTALFKIVITIFSGVGKALAGISLLLVDGGEAAKRIKEENEG